MVERIDSVELRIDGAVGKPSRLTYELLASIDERFQVRDLSRLDAKRKGDAVTLAGLMEWVQVDPDARYLGLHAATDNFHASIPLAAIRDRGLLIYRVDGQPLALQAGGPFRFFIPDHASCRSHEIDECANVKFVDHMEFTRERGFDNRPHDDAEHEALHARERAAGGHGERS